MPGKWRRGHLSDKQTVQVEFFIAYAWSEPRPGRDVYRHERGVAERIRSRSRRRERACDRLYLGSTVLAEKGQLTVFASGPKAAFESARAVFEAISARQYYVGDDQQARYLKLAINHLVGSTAVLLAEAPTLGKKGGLDWAEMLTVIGESVAASPLIRYKLDPLRLRDFKAAFSSSQMLKDMSLVVDAGESVGVPMASPALVRKQFADYAEADGAELDFFSIVRAVELSAGLHN
jgi:3-hydroxyisobutyrate dehydrogenase-like beta-hydroxyacid dehydrogenase